MITKTEISAMGRTNRATMRFGTEPPRFEQYAPLGFLAGDDNLYRIEGNDVTSKLDPSGLAVDPAAGAKGAVAAMVDKLDCPDEKKAKIKDDLNRLIDAAQFEWNHDIGPFGWCKQWVGEYFTKVKDMLANMNKDGITLHHVQWSTNAFGGHHAVRIHVNSCCQGKQGFDIYLDDSLVGGDDHVFVDNEINARWHGKQTLVESQIMTSTSTLEEINVLRGPTGQFLGLPALIGPGAPPSPPPPLNTISGLGVLRGPKY